MGQLRWWVRFGEQGWVNSRERQGLRDSVESQRMPSGLPLPPDSIEIHARSEDILERLLRQFGGEP